MLDVKLFQMQSFLPMPYEEALAPRLKKAQEKLQNGSGAGGEFTGWVQVNGLRGDTSIKERIEHDVYYIENWSILLDIKILFLTLFKGFVNQEKLN